MKRLTIYFSNLWRDEFDQEASGRLYQEIASAISAPVEDVEIAVEHKRYSSLLPDGCLKPRKGLLIRVVSYCGRRAFRKVEDKISDAIYRFLKQNAVPLNNVVIDYDPGH